MSASIDLAAFAGTDPILTLAREVFSAMIDPDPAALRPWTGDVPALVEATYAWVDLGGETPGRVLLTTERATATRLTRGLLGLADDEPVEDADLVDAFGEIANVLGGNVKSLVPDPGALTLPTVAATSPAGPVPDLLHEVRLDWRGDVLVIALWSLS
ncbi:chemotaxis protein CheX [Actinotalea sp.]|uniref:chemotaxis protein CheX n=1 Tax=Actinotalea sp. TaxID=1872145 RepID=UPI0035631013